MKILILGNDARSHCIAWKLYQSEFINVIYAYPGNPGIFKLCQKTSIKSDNFEEICLFCQKKGIELVIPGPEKYLVDGIYDFLKKRNIKVFGPSLQAAKLEGSKDFAKQFMQKYNIPNAEFKKFDNIEKLYKYINNLKKFPIVIKADGLASGKGVKVCQNKEIAFEHIKNMTDIKDINGKTEVFIIEEFLSGKEASLLCFTDGKTITPMIYSRDHKKALDNDKGDNTGGMGAFSNPYISEKAKKYIEQNIIKNTIKGIKNENFEYKGIIFIGLMISNDKAHVIEYNVRFGDPETQSVLPLLKSDLGQIIRNIFKNELSNTNIEWENKQSVCVVCTSGGYPGKYEKNIKLNIGKNINSLVFYSQIKEKNNELFTNGGRVISIVAKGNTLEQAKNNVYKDIQKIKFKQMHYRKDIAEQA
ncbi:MAG: phosphoribosylamine--glycine ligase [Candidatus Muirbacterium halophilum]|nr:phosphoribosylamine--glycine ligase [Candidatus Muirbacterium halophilum]MCK9474934.1 phosphoribosylamine--glycine ligase [Candidatus Muirbacterium halophilum]